MGDLLNDIVQITIRRATTFIEVASFNNIIIVAEFDSSSITPAFSERVREYSSLTEITEAGFSTSSAVYLAAQTLFVQNPNPGKIFVGRKRTIADGGPESWTVALTAIKEENDKWYGLHVGTRTLADLEEVADWTEANKKLFIVSDDDSNIISGTGDIADYVETNNYDRTAVIYHDKADLSANDPYIESGWAGLMFTYDPGSANWSYKKISGVPVYQLNTSQRSTAEGKNCNLFEEIAGVDVTRYGKVGSGEWIDIIRGTDWLEATIQADVMNYLLNVSKVPYNDQGIQGIRSIVNASLDKAVTVGLINDDFTVTVPLATDVDPADKAARILDDVKFTATYQGAINKVKIEGTISV